MVEPDGNELLQIGLRQAGKMQRLIQGILTTFAKEVKPIVPTLIGADIAPDLRACAREVAASLQATASLKGLSIKIDADAGDSALKVIGESERLERVLFNLLANALRHSSPGQTITIRLQGEPGFVRASVEDQGEGVPGNLVDRLFDRFSQGKEHTGLAGLGLYFCRITVENWGGSIGYSPADEGGACFWFRLPRPVSHKLPDLLTEAG
jgi:signal transduction histidine kinase